MSYKLTNETGEIFYCEAAHFMELHELAVRCGWNPDGGEGDWWLSEKMSFLYENEPTSIPVVSSPDAVRMPVRARLIQGKLYMELPARGLASRKPSQGEDEI